MIKNIIIVLMTLMIIILFVAMYFIFFSYQKNLQDTFYLSDKQIILYIRYAEDGNISAILNLQAYYAVNNNVEKFKYWQAKEQALAKGTHE